MTLRTPLWCQNAGATYDAIDMRQMLAVVLDAIGPTSIRDNLYNRVAALGTSRWPQDGLIAVQRVAGANMSVDVLIGVALIRGIREDQAGTYVCVADAATNVPIAAADPSQDRVDIIYAVVSDDAEDSSGNNQWDILVDTGTPGAGAPANSHTGAAGWLRIADVLVHHGHTSIVSADITDRRITLGTPLMAIVHKNVPVSVPVATEIATAFETIEADPFTLSGLAQGGDATKVFLQPGMWRFEALLNWAPAPGVQVTGIGVLNGTFAKNGHGLTGFSPITLTGISGATNFSNGGTYWPVNITANTFQLSLHAFDVPVASTGGDSSLTATLPANVGDRSAILDINGTTTNISRIAGVVGAITVQSASWTQRVPSGSYVRLIGYQTSAVAINVQSRFVATRIGL